MVITEDKEVDIFVGSKIGSFKHIKYFTDQSRNNKKNIENLVDIKTLQKDDGITRLEWGDNEQTEILIGRKNKQIQVYNTLTGFTDSYTADFGPGDIVGLGRCKRRLIAAVSSGVVRVWSKKSEQLVSAGRVDRLRVCQEDETLFATGGEENDLKIWKVGEEQPTFIAKNLPHDYLQLRRPVWVGDVCFLRGEGGRVAAACSRHGYVRLYDTRAQRRPVQCVEFTMAATCIANSFDERQVLVGFGRGQLHQVDLRNGKPDKGFKGSAGAITDVCAVHGNRLVVSTSLDRNLRVHEFSTKQLVYKQYLTSKLSCLLVQTESSTPLQKSEVKQEEIKDESGEMEEIDDYDKLFDKMETVGAKTKTKPPLIDEPAKKSKLTQDSPKVTPSSEGSTDNVNTEDAIKKLLRSTEKQKRRREEKKREKKAKSVFHNA